MTYADATIPDLQLRWVERQADDRPGQLLTLVSDGGPVTCRLHEAPTGDVAVLWVFGAGGGLGGPAGGIYTRLGSQLTGDGIASLEVAYRRLRDLPACVLDVRLGIHYLARLGRFRVILVGHSFGGAVVITAGAPSGSVIGVAALSSVARGTDAVDRISPRPLLVAHGDADEAVPVEQGLDIYRRAGEPKTLKRYPGCRHGLDECRDALDVDLLTWIRSVAAAPSVVESTS